MRHRIFLAVFLLSGLMLVPAISLVAQTAPASNGGKNSINGIDSYPSPGLVNYAKSNPSQSRLVDMFISDWQGSLPRAEHGSLVLRDILTKGDNFNPPERGAVLDVTNFFAYGRLAPGNWTTPSTLVKQQEVYYILGGDGEIVSGSETAKLRKDVAVFMPAGVEFVMKSVGDQPLTMYVINEPTPDGFKPKSKMVVKDEALARERTPAGGDPYIVGGASGHWAHVVKELFSPADGLATLQSVITVTVNPKTLGEPHPHKPGQEEIWAAIDGTSLAMLGTQLRVQKPGMAYMVRPDGEMIHSNINAGDAPVKFLYFARFPATSEWTHGAGVATK